MSKPSSGLFQGTYGARAAGAGLFEKQPSPIALRRRSQPIPPDAIRFSQSSVNGTQKIAESMRKNGWVGPPIDVVRMEDGALTTLDNTRVQAARMAGIDVRAIVHEADEPLPSQVMIDRFTTPRGGAPRTWGQAVKNRIGKQRSSFRREHPLGSYNIDKAN